MSIKKQERLDAMQEVIKGLPEFLRPCKTIGNGDGLFGITTIYTKSKLTSITNEKSEVDCKIQIYEVLGGKVIFEAILYNDLQEFIIEDHQQLIRVRDIDVIMRSHQAMVEYVNKN